MAGENGQKPATPILIKILSAFQAHTSGRAWPKLSGGGLYSNLVLGGFFWGSEARGRRKWAKTGHAYIQYIVHALYRTTIVSHPHDKLSWCANCACSKIYIPNLEGVFHGVFFIKGISKGRIRGCWQKQTHRQ